MRNIFRITVMVSLILTSCSKDFITLEPTSTTSVGVLYKTDKDFKDAIISCYSILQVQYKVFWMFGDVRGDDAADELNKGTPGAIDNFYVTNDDGVIKSTWSNYYNLIYRANTILEKIESADITVVTNKDQYIGEAKFLRALAYFDLVRIYGDVPMITSPLTIAATYKAGRDKAEAIYNDVIISDLLDAAAKLPLKYSGAEVGRATKGAAKSILGRVYMTTHQFPEAVVVLREVTTMGYSLLKNYNDLFDYTKDEHHSEYIFDIEYESGIDEGSSFNSDFMPNSAPMLNLYQVIGPGKDYNSPTEKLFGIFDPTDARKDITVGVKGGFYGKDGEFIPFFLVNAQAYTKKYIVASSYEDGPANWKVIRYADVLLMYAEALNETDHAGDALIYLNEVHRRAGLTDYKDLNQVATREKIYLERRLELSFEGVRWFDLVRTERAYDALKDRGMRPYMTVFPIPLSQIQLMNDPSIFPQNEGYN